MKANSVAGEIWSVEAEDSIQRAQEKGLSFIRRFEALEDAIGEALLKEQDNPTSPGRLNKIHKDQDTLQAFRNSVKKPGKVLQDSAFLELERLYL